MSGSRVVIFPRRLRLVVHGLYFVWFGAILAFLLLNPAAVFDWSAESVLFGTVCAALAVLLLGTGFSWIWWAMRNVPSLEASEDEVIIRSVWPFVARRARWADVRFINQYRGFSRLGTRYHIEFDAGGRFPLEITQQRLREPIPTVLARLLRETGARRHRFVDLKPPPEDYVTDAMGLVSKAVFLALPGVLTWGYVQSVWLSR